MADATADWRHALSLMSEAYRLGENGRGEELLTVALVATSTAAQALSAYRSSSSMLPTETPMPA